MRLRVYPSYFVTRRQDKPERSSVEKGSLEGGCQPTRDWAACERLTMLVMSGPETNRIEKGFVFWTVDCC